jgi:hypothetical protein
VKALFLADHPWSTTLLAQVVNSFELSSKNTIEVELSIVDYYQIQHLSENLKAFRDRSSYEVSTQEENFKNWQEKIQSIDENILDNFLLDWETRNCLSRTLKQVEMTNRFLHAYEDNAFLLRVPSVWKKRMLYDTIKWCENKIDNFDPDFLLSIERANLVVNVMQVLCENRNIKFYNIMPARIENRWILSSNFGLEMSQKVYREVLNQETNLESDRFIAQMRTNFTGSYNSQASQIRQNFKDNKFEQYKKFFLNLVKMLKQLYSRFFIESHLRLLKPRRLEQAYLRLTLFEIRKMFFSFLRISGIKVCGNFSLPEQRYILWALHARPEDSTLVLGEGRDEIDELIEFASLLPKNILLVVKESPIMFGTRGKNFYRRLKSLPNVYLLDCFFETPLAIVKSIGVAGISGTVIMEASLLKVPSCALGKTEFDKLLDYSGWENARDFVQNLSVHDFSSQFSKFEKYVSWVFENSINDSVSYGELADKSKIKRFADGIVKVINQDYEGLDFYD